MSFESSESEPTHYQETPLNPNPTRPDPLTERFILTWQAGNCLLTHMQMESYAAFSAKRRLQQTEVDSGCLYLLSGASTDRIQDFPSLARWWLNFNLGWTSSFSVRSANRCIKQKQIGIKGSELAADKSWSSGPSRFGMQKKPLCRLLLLAGDRAENAALFRHSWQSVDPVLNYWRWDTT